MAINGRTVAPAAIIALVLLGPAGSSYATDQGITGKRLLLKGPAKFVLLSKDLSISIAGSDPVGGADSSLTFDNGGGPVIYTLPKGLWSKNGAGTLFKYKNANAPGPPSAVKVAKVKSGLLKMVGKGIPFAVPNGAASVDVVVSLDGGTNRYCMTFSGTGDGSKFLVKDATAGTCPPPLPTATPSVTPTVTATATATGTATATPTNTPTPCPYDGKPVGGSCWYLGVDAASCDATCANIFEDCDLATISYTGSGGTSSNCSTVLTALGVTDPYAGDSSCGNPALGCIDETGIISGRCTGATTTCAAGGSSVQRVCACHKDCPDGGQFVGGSCWYLGVPGASCDATCTGLGLTCSAGTISYAGSGGTLGNCAAVMTALGVSEGGTADNGCLQGAGCVDDPAASLIFRCTSPPTTCAASFDVGLGGRACACQ